MALTTTTLSAAATASATSLTVASATGFTAGNLVLVDQELMRVSKAYSSGTTIILDGRGLNGTRAVAHVSSANCVTGLPSDFADPGLQQSIIYPAAGRVRTLISYSASGAITLPTPGQDVVAVLNGTSVLSMTLANPTKDMDGCILTVVANGAAAHTITYTAGLGNAGGSYDVLTANGTGTTSVQLIAINGFWTALHTITGTQTNIGWAIA